MAEIEAIRLALQHKHDLAQLVSIKEVALQAGPRAGVEQAIKKAIPEIASVGSV